MARMSLIGNAWFATTLFLIPNHWKNIVLITSDFHIERSQLVFKDIMKLCLTEHHTIQCIATPTMSMDKEVLSLRMSREAKSRENWKNTMNDIHTMSDFAKWFYLKHDAYSCSSFNIQSGSDNIGSVGASY